MQRRINLQVRGGEAVLRISWPYRCVQFLLFSGLSFTTDSEEKDHGITRQEVSHEVRR